MPALKSPFNFQILTMPDSLLPKPTVMTIMYVTICGCSSAVERLLAKEKVVSSNLIARSSQK